MTSQRSRALALPGPAWYSRPCSAGMARLAPVRMGRQPDGSFLVSSGQRIEGGSIAFTGRPIDLARASPRRGLRRAEQVRGLPGRPATAPRGAPGRSLHQGGRDLGRIPRARLVARRLAALRQHQPRLCPGLRLQGRRAQVRGDDSSSSPRSAKGNPVPGGMAITRDGTRLFVAAANRNAVAEIDLDDAQVGARVSRADAALTSRGSRRTSGRWSSATGAAGCRGPAIGPPRARTSTSWSTTAGRRRRGRSA